MPIKWSDLRWIGGDQTNGRATVVLAPNLLELDFNGHGDGMFYVIVWKQSPRGWETTEDVWEGVDELTARCILHELTKHINPER